LTVIFYSIGTVKNHDFLQYGDSADVVFLDKYSHTLGIFGGRFQDNFVFFPKKNPISWTTLGKNKIAVILPSAGTSSVLISRRHLGLGSFRYMGCLENICLQHDYEKHSDDTGCTKNHTFI